MFTALEIKSSLQIAMQHLRNGRLEKVEEICINILKSNDNYSDAYHLLGVAYHEAGNYDKAVNAYSESIRLDPSNAEKFFNLGLSLARQDAMDEALESFEKAIEIMPDYQPAYSQVCNLKRTSGDFEGAALAGRKAIELNPRDLNTLRTLGYALTGIGETEDAVKACKQAIALAPGSVKYVVELGYAYLCNNEPEKALAECDKALKIDPNHISGLAFKSMALNELNRRKEAGFILNFDHLIQIKIFDSIEGYENVTAFNKALTDHIHVHSSLAYMDNNRSLTYGQNTGQIFDGCSDNVLTAFQGMIKQAVTEYFVSHPETPDHPFLMSHPKDYQLESWGNIIDKNGYQDVHIHPVAWLSGVYYPSLPKSMETSGDDHEGWIEFGRAFYMIKSTDNPPVRLVKPEEGLMVLFPSYFGHRTIPINSDEKRVSVAFNIIKT